MSQSAQLTIPVNEAASGEGVKQARRFRYDPRYTPPLFITLILATGHWSFGILESLEKTLLSIGVAILTETVLSRIYLNKWPHLASAYISGISVGILLRSPFFWPFAVCAALTIMSKYVVRYRGQHLFNPSNFGISALLFLSPGAVAHLSVQWGNHIWPMLVIWILGSVIVYRVKRFHISATYVAFFFIFAWLRTLITGDPFVAEIAPITGPMYQLFVFFMITDPKTNVRSKKGQIVVAILVALVEMLLRLGEVIHAPFYALFLVGPIALFLELWWNARKAGRLQAAVA
jgi:Na+-translocating ferredoxin:NAD+ oxidoreductase RnfD subunit